MGFAPPAPDTLVEDEPKFVPPPPDSEAPIGPDVGTVPAGALPNVAALKAGKIQSAGTDPRVMKVYETGISPEVGKAIFRPLFDITGVTAVPKLMDKLFPKNPVSAISEGIMDVGGDLTAALSSPKNASLMLAGGALGKLGTVLLSAGFEAQALKHAPEQYKEFKDALEAGDYQKATRVGGNLVAGIGLPAAGVAIHGAAPPKTSLLKALGFTKPTEVGGEISAESIPKNEASDGQGIRQGQGGESSSRDLEQTPSGETDSGSGATVTQPEGAGAVPAELTPAPTTITAAEGQPQSVVTTEAATPQVDAPTGRIDAVMQSAKYIDDVARRKESDGAGVYHSKTKEINLPSNLDLSNPARVFLKAHEEAHHIWDGLQNVTAAESIRNNPEALAEFNQTSAAKSQVIRNKSNLAEPSTIDWIEAIPDVWGEIKAKGLKLPALEKWLNDVVPDKNLPSPNDFTPALKTSDGTVIKGEQGQTHQNIYDAQADPAALQASEPEHGFVDKEGNFKSRQEVSTALGEADPMQSERLTELQKNKEPSTTGIAQRVHEERAGGDVQPGTGAGPEEMINRGRELLKGGADPQVIVDKVNAGNGVTGDEMATLRAHVEELSKASDRAQDALDKNPNDPAAKAAADAAWKAETEWRQKIKPAQTEWQKIGAAQQGETDIDTGSFTGLRRLMVDEKGRDATPAEQAKLREVAKKARKTETDVEQAKQAYDKAIGTSDSKITIKQENLREHFADRLRELLPCEL